MSSVVPKLLDASSLKVFRDGSKFLAKIQKVDPRERYVLIMPDADRAHIGMGFRTLNIPLAEKAYDIASEIAKKDILKLCLDGPKSELLDSIENRQLATFVTTHATLNKLAHEQPDKIPLCKAAGGIGVGFINSLVFSKAISFENAADLIQRQGKAIDRVVKAVPTAKVKVRVRAATRKSLVCRAAIEYCLKQGIPEEIAICSVTKQPSPHVLEIAGHEEAIKFIENEGQRLFEFYRIARVLSQPHALNTPLMAPVEEFLRSYISHKMKEDPSYLRDPETCSVYSSTLGVRSRATDSVRKAIINYPVKCVNIEALFTCLFHRPANLAQPNTLVLWDRPILKNLELVNRKAYAAAKLYL